MIFIAPRTVHLPAAFARPDTAVINGLAVSIIAKKGTAKTRKKGKCGRPEQRFVITDPESASANPLKVPPKK